MTSRIITLLCLFTLAACTPADSGLALQADYLQRLTNALDGEHAAPFDPSQLTRYRMPPRRERLLEIAEIRIGLLDLLVDVRRCPPLQQQISQRNSILGKQMVPSSRLAYEGELLRAIDACVAHLQAPDDQQLRENLEQLAAQKRTQLSSVFWNAWNGSTEVEHYLRFAEQTLPVTPLDDGAALAALAQLAHVASGLPQVLPPPAEELESLFFALHASDQGGRLISSLASLSHSLNQASELLERRQQQRPICPQGKATPRARIVQNIFVKYYAGAMQPYLAEIDQRGRQWSQQLRRLAAITTAPATTRSYLTQLAGTEDSLWLDFQQATTRHVQAWQRTLQSCGLAPGQSGWNAAATNP
ncbi:DUF3080 family protein [Pseudomonas borbori]